MPSRRWPNDSGGAATDHDQIVFTRLCWHANHLGSFRGDVCALFGYGPLHQQHQEDQQHPQYGAQPENVKVGQRCGLLLAEVVEDIYAPLMRKGRVS